MAEPLGLAASIIQIADAGVALSTTLFNLGSANRADSDIADIADDVKLTANALYSIGKMIENEDGQSGLSGKATQDAGNLILQCEALFTDIQQIADKRRKSGRDGKRSANSLAKPAGSSKEESVKVLKKRLENSTDSLMLMQHILHLANEQAKGEIDESVLDQERNKIRDLHQRQQESLKALHYLEGRVAVSDEDTLQGSNASSRVPTIEFLMNTPGRKQSTSLAKNYSWSANSVSTAGYLSNDSHTSDSDHTMTEDEADFVVPETLAQCATQVQKLLKRIVSAQHANNRCSKHRVHKWYRHFCRKFESDLENRKEDAVAPAAPFPGFQPSQPINASAAPREEACTVSVPQPIIKRDGPPHNPYSQSTRVDHDRAEKNANAAQTTSRPPLSIQHPHHTLTPGETHTEIHPQYLRTEPTPTFTPTNAPHEVASREGSKDGSQSGIDPDNVLSSHGSGPVHYTKTGRVSKAKKGLKVHTCTECGKSFTRAEHLRRHQKNHSSDQVSCQLCGKVFFRVDLLMRHVERHKDGPILNASTPGAQSSMSPQESGQSHRPDERYHRSTESAEGDQPPQWYYVWNEAEKRYDVQHANRAMPPPAEQVVAHRTDQADHPQTHDYGTPRVFRDSVNSPQTRHELPRPHPDERRHFQSAFHQSPPSPIRSPPSPWVKEARTLPPLRPSPSQATFGQSRDSTTVEVSMPPTSPALQHQPSAMSTLNPPVWYSKGTNSVNMGTYGPQILPRPDYHDRSDNGIPQGPSPSEKVEKRQEARNFPSTDSSWSKARSSEDQRRYSSTDPAQALPKSQSTSPSSINVIRTYPNPIRPHEPRREVSLGRSHASQDVPSPSPTPNANSQSLPAVAQDATASPSIPGPSKYGSLEVEDPKIGNREHESTPTQRDGGDPVQESGDAVSGKRKKEEETGRAGQTTEEQDADLRARDSKRQRLEEGVTSDGKNNGATHD